MYDVQDETVRVGVPVLLGVWNSFQWSRGRKQFLSQVGRDKFVRFPSAFGRADLGSRIRQFWRKGIGKGGLYFYPSLWITQKCVPVDLPEYIIDLNIKVRTGGAVQTY